MCLGVAQDSSCRKEKKKQLVPCSKERYSFWTFSHQEPRRITRFDVRPQSLVPHHYNLQVRPLEAASPVAVLLHPLLLNRHQPLSITENPLAVQCQRILPGPRGANLHFWMGGEQREVHASAPTRCLPSQLYFVSVPGTVTPLVRVDPSSQLNLHWKPP